MKTLDAYVVKKPPKPKTTPKPSPPMPNISNAPEPIAPLRGRGVNYSPADAKKWINVPVAPLWEVVALSLGIEPTSLNMRRRSFTPKIFRDRFDVAWANCGRGLPACEHGASDVSLADFGAWAEDLPSPLDLPGWFPRNRAEPARAVDGASLDASPSEAPAADATDPQSESSAQRCARLLTWFREEEAKKKRGALARVVARDGRARQTVSKDVEQGIANASPSSKSFASMAGTVSK